MVSSGTPPLSNRSATALPDSLQDKSNAVLGAYEPADHLLGWVHVQSRHTVELEPYAEVRALVVDEEVRGRGTGRRLMDAAESWAKANGYSTMQVRSNVKRERTHRFYERLGYTTTKTSHVFSKPLMSSGQGHPGPDIPKREQALQRELSLRCHSLQVPELRRIRTGCRCNCSICIRKGAVMSSRDLAPEEFDALEGKESLTVYQFGDREVNHYFCSRCGTYPFHDGTAKPGHYRVNLGCVDGLDPLLPQDQHHRRQVVSRPFRLSG